MDKYVFNMNSLMEILTFANTSEDINKYANDIMDLIPKTSIMYGYDQMSYAHQYDLWNHSVHTVLNLPKYQDGDDEMLYLAAFLHDIAKPTCRIPDKKHRTDENGRLNHMHYNGHPEKCAKLVGSLFGTDAFAIFGKFERSKLLFYIKHHDDEVSNRPRTISNIEKAMKEEIWPYRSLSDDIKDDIFKNLMLLEAADAEAHIIDSHPKIRERYEVCKFLASEEGIKMFSKIRKNGCKGIPRLNIPFYYQQ